MTNIFVDNRQRNEVYVWLSFWVTIITSIASIVTIILIRRMKSNTGHVRLLYLMTIYQLFYDGSIFFSDIDVGYYLSAFANVLQLFGGTAGAITSNWIAFVAMYIVWNLQTFDIFRNMPWIHVTCLVPALVTCLLYFFATVPRSHENDTLRYDTVVYVYNNIRLLSIFLNFIFVLATAGKIYRSARTKYPQDVAIRTLTLRMIYYPVLQAIGRSGYTWYEFAYGPKTDNDDFSDTQYAAQIFAISITPVVSVGYLVIFLVMQPDAYRHFVNLCYCRWTEDASSSSSSPSSPSANERDTVSSESSSARRTDFVDYTVSEARPRAPDDGRDSGGLAWMRQSQSWIVQGLDMRDEDELYLMIDGGERTTKGRPSSILTRHPAAAPASGTAANATTGRSSVFTTENILHSSSSMPGARRVVDDEEQAL